MDVNLLNIPGILRMIACYAIENPFEMFYEQFDFGNVENVKWLVETFSFTRADIRSRNNYVLKFSCMRGHLELVKWLVESFNLTIDDIYYENQDCTVLQHSCENGHLEVVEWMIDKFSFTIKDVRSCNNYALRYTCLNGHIEIARLLVNKFNLTMVDVLVGVNFARSVNFRGIDSGKARILSLNFFT